VGARRREGWPSSQTKEAILMRKPIVNVGTIGHVDHGKTTLTAALTQVMALRHGGTPRRFDQLDRAPAEKLRGVTINLAHVEYESARRRYAHIDCPGHADYIKNMITGASQMDGAIVLVDATQGGEAQTREHVLLARQVGVRHVVVFVNKMDVAGADELVDLVVLEVDELLCAHGYPDAPVVKGSALRALQAIEAGDLDDPWVAAIDELVETLDRTIPDPVRDVTSPLLVTVEAVHTIDGIGTVVTGCVGRGTVRVGDRVDILGGRRAGDVVAEPVSAVITGIESFHRERSEAEAGDNVGLRLRGVRREQVARGHVLAAPGSIRPQRECRAELFLLAAAEGGRARPIRAGYRPQVYVGAIDVTASLALDPGVSELVPGGRAEVGLEFVRPIAIEPGVRFALREGGRTIGAGVVTAV